MSDPIQFPTTVPTSDSLKVIRDRIGGRYLASWSGPEHAPETFTWAEGLDNAHTLTAPQSHMLRAGILSSSEANGGLPETSVSILTVADAQAMEKARTGLGTEPVILVHPTRGYYVKHSVKGDQWTITWTKLATSATFIPRHTAEGIKELSGIPALQIMAASSAHKMPPFRSPEQPQAIMRYEILVAGNTNGMEALVNMFLKKGAKLVGGLAVKTTPTSSEYLQAIVISDTIPGEQAHD